MMARSERHHEVPIWLAKHFCRDCDERLWMGFKDTHEVRLVGVRDAFVRRNTNTRTSYQSRQDGTFQQVKSDSDERILERFDGPASSAARELINFARQWRDMGPVAPRLSPETVEVCKRLIVVQARRTRESQDRVGLGEDETELYLDLYFKRAEEVGQWLPPREVLLEDPSVTAVFDAISQNTRAGMSSGNHPILVENEEEFLAPLGLHVAVIDPTTTEFVIGSHGITVTQERNTWLPLAPDVAISFSDRPGSIGIGMCANEFVGYHNRAALSISSRVAGRSKGRIAELLATLD